MQDKNFGVIQEQGFVVGSNLGFNPLTESEKKKLEEKKSDNDKNKAR